MEKRKLMRALWRRFPRSAAEEGDFIGRQVGRFKDDIERIFLALDFDETIYEAAFDFKPDMILTHHPFIYGRKQDVFKLDPQKAELTARLEREIACAIVSMHTNFDNGCGGMNDTMALQLELINVHRNPQMPMMVVGELPEAMNIEAFMDFILKKTKVSYASLVHAGVETVRRLGFICGGGSGFFRQAMADGCDIYISGDCPHHVRRDIIRYNMNYVDIPHEVERIFIPRMKEVLFEIDPTLTVLEVDHEQEARMYIAD